MSRGTMYNYIAETKYKSGDVDTSHKMSTNNGERLNSQTVTFRDGPTEWQTSMSEGLDSQRLMTVHNDVDLGDFFSRPIPIYRYVWTPGTPQAIVPYFDPWTLFLANPRVANRMTNYKNFYGKLHLKFMVNGNSFYFGRMMPAYIPLATDDTAFNPQDVRIKTLMSQRLKMFIDPCESTGGEMELPFIWYRDMLDITVPGNIALMGRLGLVEMNPLLHANGASTSIEISVYAWMTDVSLSAPTATDITTLVPQAGSRMAKVKNDEYGKGPVSAVASALAAGAGMLTSIPVIGKYMRATQMMLGSAAGVAELFGFAKPTIISDVIQMRSNPVSKLAVTSGGDASAKLTVDPKQEVSIDPSIVGLDGLDEMALNSIACRETYMHLIPWTVAAAPDQFLCSIRVTPLAYLSDTGRITLPACAYAAWPFQYWRGTVRYRFQIVASAYHKGRLKFVWDPAADTGVPESNVAYTKIVDISNERDFVVDVSWAGDSTWKSASSAIAFNNTAPVSRLDAYNGNLNVYVLNSLTVPNSAVTNDISINVYMSMCDDAEFAEPREIFSNSVISLTAPTVPTPQSGDVENLETVEDSPTAGESTEEFVPCAPTSDDASSVYFGEKITSLRQLVKRYSLLTTFFNLTAGTSHFNVNVPNFPMTRGFTTNAAYGTGLSSLNYSNTTMANWLSYAFLLYRGGIRYKYIAVPYANSNTCQKLEVTRNVGLFNGLSMVPVTSSFVITTQSTAAADALANKPFGGAGSHVTVGNVLPVNEVELPFYTYNRFHMARSDSSSVPYDACRTSATHRVYCSFSGTSTLEVYTAGADDLTFHLFQGCRPFYSDTILG